VSSVAGFVEPMARSAKEKVPFENRIVGFSGDLIVRWRSLATLALRTTLSRSPPPRPSPRFAGGGSYGDGRKIWWELSGFEPPKRVRG